MSEALFETLTADEFAAEGGSGSAERGIYTQVLEQFVASGEQYAKLPMDRGPFKGKKAASVSTSLKGARDGKNADEKFGTVKISSRGGNAEKGIPGAVYLENSAVGA